MNTTARLAIGAGALLAFSTLGAVAPAQAATAHCPMPDGSTKYEVDGGSTVNAGLEPGTTVCIKAGTQVAEVEVAQDGSITNTTILNKNGKALGISYYVVSEEPDEPCEPNVSLSITCPES